MAKMGRYCKAYPVSKFREFSGWTENLSALRKERHQGEKSDAGLASHLADDAFLYLQENLTITDGIFMDENVVFDAITPQWEDFCKNVLGFEVPFDRTVSAKESNGHAAASNG